MSTTYPPRTWSPTVVLAMVWSGITMVGLCLFGFSVLAEGMAPRPGEFEDPGAMIAGLLLLILPSLATLAAIGLMLTRRRWTRVLYTCMLGAWSLVGPFMYFTRAGLPLVVLWEVVILLPILFVWLPPSNNFFHPWGTVPPAGWSAPPVSPYPSPAFPYPSPASPYPSPTSPYPSPAPSYPSPASLYPPPPLPGAFPYPTPMPPTATYAVPSVAPPIMPPAPPFVPAPAATAMPTPPAAPAPDANQVPAPPPPDPAIIGPDFRPPVLPVSPSSMPKTEFIS